MQVLAIGNSFSQDASAYLHKIAQSAGKPIDIVNSISPAALERHFRNMMSDSSYELEVKATYTGFWYHEEALLNRRWDVETIQQASHLSTNGTATGRISLLLPKSIRKLARFPHSGSPDLGL